MGDMLNVPDTSTIGSATGNTHNKVALKRGRGIMDWVRLEHSGSDLAGTGGKLLKITPEELAKHNKREDAWMSLKGQVYNVTPYFEYHPGGEDELIKGAGIDATDLFNQVHKWVNFTSMLKKCHVGTLVESKSFFSKPNFLPLKKIGRALDSKKESCLFPSSVSLPGLKSTGKSPIVSPQAFLRLPPPKYDWFQTKTLINVAIYTKWKEVQKCHVVLVNDELFFKTMVYIRDKMYTIHLELFKPLERKFELKIGNGAGKVDILMRKSLPGLRWTSLGKALRGHGEVVPSKDKQIEFLTFNILEKTRLTHNTLLFILEVPDYIHFGVPIGHHVYLRHPQSDVVKPYTPVITPFKVYQKDEECSEKSIQIYFKVYPDGALTPHLERLKEGDEIEVSFPEGTFSMDNLRQATVDASHLVLLGAGTGITPHIKLMLEALKNEVKTILVTFNKTEEDIPWKIELDSLVVIHSKLLRVSHVLSNPSVTWNSYKGHVREDLLEELLPSPGEEKSLFICICGTTGFTKLTLSLLEEMGFEKENIFAFLG